MPVPHFKHDANSCNPCNIVIRGLSDKFDAESLRAECEKFGNVVDVQIVLHPRTQQSLGSGTVKFEDARAARAARIGLNNASRYSKKLTTHWDADGKGATREVNEALLRENPPPARTEEKPKSWVAQMPKMDDMEVDDWSTPGAWMKKFSAPVPKPNPAGSSALLETPRAIPRIHQTGVILHAAPIQATAHAAALAAAYAHRPLPPPIVAKPPPPAPVITVVKSDSAPDSPYDPNAAFDEPPSPPPTTPSLTQSQIVLQNQSYTVSKTITPTVDQADVSMVDEQMEMTPPRGSDYDPHNPSDPQSPISTEWYYMQSAQTHPTRAAGYPYPPPPPTLSHAQAAAHAAAVAAQALAYPYTAAYPPPPGTTYPGYPAYPQPPPPPPVTTPALPRRSPQPGTFAVQISRLSIANDGLVFI